MDRAENFVVVLIYSVVSTSSTSYQCSGNVGGACDNNARVRRSVVEDKILQSIGHELLSPERVGRMGREIEILFAERLREPTEKSTREEIQELDSRIERLQERLHAGDP